MDESISSRTRSNLLSELVTDWKICDENFKMPRRTVSKIPQNNKHKKDIIMKINEELDNSTKKYETCIHELNYLQSGHIFIYYKKIQTVNDGKVENLIPKTTDEYEMSTKYFIDESDDSDPEYIDSEEINNRVIAERVILNRVEELKRNNLWSAKMIPKKADPLKPVFHWDLFIKEMKWMQENISSVKQVKRIDARKLAIAATKYVKEKEAHMTRNYKEETIRAKKHCLNVSRIIKEWWKQMQKIVSAKQKFRLDARRQEAINDHLGKVIETTQKYTEWLTEDLKVIPSGDNDTSTDDDPEFKMERELTDDEETIDKDEIEMDYNVEEEIEALKLQNKMSLEDILNELPADYFKIDIQVNNNLEEKKTNDEIKYPESQEETDDKSCSDHELMKIDDEEHSDDCEETMVEQEIFENENNEEKSVLEIDDLKRDAEIPMDELIELYMKIHSSSSHNKEQLTTNNIIDNLDSESSETENESSADSDSSSYESSVDLGLVFNIETDKPNIEESLEFKGQFKEISEVAMSTQPRGFTLESTDVKVQIPFLLKYTLREYQHVGLDWMAAIYEKRLNGVLADEMGLGKTIQTIALLAYLSCEKGIWGPHLVVVPTSVVLNWEIEFKKWCPGFKILTYFGSFKERKEKRKGWTKTNAFHVCITSYKLAIQDSQVFKRKKWKYMILDEAQNIKNFKSQRWQTLLTFNSQRRLLLTGTPLQNNLMELWSLMHFLMPTIFQSHREFNEWFGSPLSGMIEGSKEYNEQLVVRLHKVLRPFILRRLKKDVEKQMPHKYEHLVMCPLSKRQRFLYDDYMSLTSTKEMLSSGQFMSIINILMQLRKVCNHPNLFEDRPTLSPFSMIQDPVDFNFPRILLIDDLYEHRMTNGKCVLPAGTRGLADMSINLPKFVSERIMGLSVKPNLIEEVDNIQVTDWVTKFSEKFSDCPMPTSFIPRDLIDYLNKSETVNEKPVSLPNPLMYGLKIRKVPNHSSKNILPTDIRNKRREERLGRLHLIRQRNSIRCSTYVSIGTDVVDAVNIHKSETFDSWESINNNSLLKRRSLEEYINDYIEIVDKVTFVIPAVLAYGVRINTSSRTLLNTKFKSETVYNENTSFIPDCLSRIRQNQLVQFPDTRLIEYDCGKLQVLVPMLKKLKSEGHRCLIFTQMTRMLDVLEQFLSYHGYRYLRLDGTTKIEQRQIMMEQFNKDDRIFVFILSTRSGGIGVNLTGADTVIFYDSDWNPTMDAQAQDRCHRIGQTRDVHIYRLISRMTIEENILKKANEKRCLNEMAIEGGQFNMSFFKSNTLQDIFQTPTGLEASISTDEDNNLPKTYVTSRGRVVKWKGDKSIFSSRNNNELQESRENRVLDSSQFEAALEEVEEESDRLAAKFMRAEAKADLVEFDETVPWDDTEEGSIKTDNDDNKFRLEMELQLENFNSQLNPLQKYGVSWIEQSFENVLCSQLVQEETQIENDRQAWELDQIKALHEDHEEMKNIEEDDMLYIYGSYDPYAAQREELEKLRKEEELQLILELRREEELAKREKDKAAAQAWAQEQHRNALKRKSEINDNEKSVENTNDSDSIPRASKTRKVIIPRLEFPDESITNSKTINTSHVDDTDQPLVSSSSSSLITDNIPFPVKRKIGRPAWKNIPSRALSFNRSPFSNERNLQNGNESEMNTSQTKSLSSRQFSELNSSNTQLDDTSTNNSFTQLKKRIPSTRRIRPSWKNMESNNFLGNGNLNSFITEECRNSSNPNGSYSESKLSEIQKLPQSRRIGRPPGKNISTISQFENGSIFQRKKSFSLSRRFGNFPRKQRPINRSPNENIAPYSNETFNSSSFTNPFKQTFKACENIPNKNGYHKFQNLNASDDFTKASTDNSEQKRRGRPPAAELRNKTDESNGNSIRNRNCSDSTNATATINKKNSFKIPVKTLNGEHKLFSAPLLLLKTKPVFVVTRKIEDNQGNVYTQNLTYPIECNESFTAIAAKLSSFAASTSSGK